MNEINKILNQIYNIECSTAFRKMYFENDFFNFAIYYFGQNFKTWIKKFHKDIYSFLNTDKNWIIIWFRESGKTAIIALIYVVWCIAYQKESFILFMAYDIESAKDKVLNVSNFLRSNKRFKRDYWLLFDDWDNHRSFEKFNAQKTMSKFVSTTWVKVEAVSLKNMKRWKQLLDEEWNIIRPSLLIADDIDIEESVRNIRIIDENEAKINSWVLKSIKWRFIILWNIIAEDWIIQRLEKKFKNYWYTQRISLIENNEIIWPERFVWKKEDADKINNEKWNWEKIVQSIEELSIDKESFNSDFLNIPRIIVWDPVFNIENLKKLEIVEPIQTFEIKVDDRVVKLEIFYKNFRKDYYDYLYAWIDTWSWQGDGSDSSDLCFLDQNWELYARVNSNIINYKHIRKLLWILYNDYWFTYFKNSLCIERNMYWLPLIEEIKENDIIIFKNLYIPKTQWQKISKYTNIVWWNTTASSKEKLKEDLNMAINLWKLKLSNEEFKEFIWWTKSDMNWKIIYEPDGVNVKHDDRIIWRWLAFQMFLQSNPNFLWMK